MYLLLIIVIGLQNNLSLKTHNYIKQLFIIINVINIIDTASTTSVSIIIL